MTGTSLDGLDVALAELTGRGRELRVRFAGHHSRPLPDALRPMLRRFADGEAHPPAALLRAARLLGALHADAVAELCEQHLPRGAALAFVAAHGQTICHLPGEHLSWQLFDPWPVVRKLNVPVVYDLRQADLIAGGEGAPITPIADPILYGRDEGMTINLGGICNVSHWGRFVGVAGQRFEIDAYDLCPCNLLLDGLADRLLGKPYDADGSTARSGRVVRSLRHLIADQVEAAQAAARSLGREQFGPAWIEHLLSQAPAFSPGQWLASACAYVARQVRGEAEGRAVKRAILAGGGTRNATLMRMLQRMPREDVHWCASDELGIPSEAREALAFAVLGALCDDGVPITMPGVTGSNRPGVAGAWAGRG